MIDGEGVECSRNLDLYCYCFDCIFGIACGLEGSHDNLRYLLFGYLVCGTLPPVIFIQLGDLINFFPSSIFRMYPSLLLCISSRSQVAKVRFINVYTSAGSRSGHLRSPSSFTAFDQVAVLRIIQVHVVVSLFSALIL